MKQIFKISEGSVVVDSAKDHVDIDYKDNEGNLKRGGTYTLPRGKTDNPITTALGTRVVVDLTKGQVYEGSGLPDHVIRERDPSKKMGYVEQHYKKAPVLDK